MNTNQNDRELSWDDVIPENAQPYEFKLIPKGDYYFLVESLEKGRFNGNEKNPPCSYAEIKLRIVDENDAYIGKVTHRVYLKESNLPSITGLFTTVGLKESGKALKMCWDELPGCRGRVRITTRKYKNKSGEEVEINSVSHFLCDEVPF